MANPNNPHGFRPLMRSVVGGPGAACVYVYKPSTVGTALFIGDPVTKLTGGTAQPWPQITGPSGITPGTTPVLGVNLNWGAASTATNHTVIPVDYQVFEVQANGTVNITDAHLTENANMNLGTSGSTLTQLSGALLDSNTIATSNTLDLKILGLLQTQTNAIGQYARLEVVFNNPQSRPQVAGV
jgi:hypothetical protein